MLDHVVLAGATGRLMAQAGLTAHTRYEVDHRVVDAALSTSKELGRPITGPELFDLWEAAHTMWTHLQPSEQERTFQLLIRVAERMSPALKAAASATDRLAARLAEFDGARVLAQMTADAPSHAVLPDWITDPDIEEPPSWL